MECGCSRLRISIGTSPSQATAWQPCLLQRGRLGFTAAPPGPPPGGGNGVVYGVGALAMHLDVPEAVVETWMNRTDSVMLASLIHLLENTLEDIREHDAAYLLPVGMHVVTTTAITAKTTSVGRAIAAGAPASATVHDAGFGEQVQSCGCSERASRCVRRSLGPC